jgi:Deoxyhypusine synthase
VWNKRLDSDLTVSVNLLITMAHSINLRVVAEGVETAEQLEWLMPRRLRHHSRVLLQRAVVGSGSGAVSDGAGDFPICVVPMLHQDLQRTGVPLWGYFCQISDSTTSYGSYSGAVPNEKITWGKLGIDTPKHIIESDASIVAPLMFAYVLGW